MSRPSLARWMIVLLVLQGLVTAVPAGRTATAYDALLAKMQRLRDEENGGVKTQLTQRKAQEIAKRLKDISGEITAFQEANPKQKLDATLVKVLQSRAEDWGDDPNYPLITSPANSKNADHIRNTSKIRGERLLVCASVKAEWRWRVVVTRDTRDDQRMEDWIVAHAKAVAERAHAKVRTKDPKLLQKAAQDAWSKLYPGLKIEDALEGSAPGYDVHHEKPLYIGKASGGVDSGDPDPDRRKGNYRLLKKRVHQDLHGSGGACRTEWGSPKLYVPPGNPTIDIDETDTGDLGR